MTILIALKKYIDFLDNPPVEDQDQKLLKLLDEILVANHQIIYPEFDDKSYPEPPDRISKYDELYNNIGRKFKRYGYYNLLEKVTTELCESDFLLGDAIDDLVDIYLEFSEIIWRFENTSELDAIMHFKEYSKGHWEYHLRYLQFYIYSKISGH